VLAHPVVPTPPPVAVAEGVAVAVADPDGLGDAGADVADVGITTVAVADPVVVGPGGGGTGVAGDDVHPASSTPPTAAIPTHPNLLLPNFIEHHLNLS
jgi:hypothetical protein